MDLVETKHWIAKKESEKLTSCLNSFDDYTLD